MRATGTAAPNRRRVALIYDRTVRANTTGVHCERALRRLGHEVIHVAPVTSQGGTLSFHGWRELPDDVDLYLQIDDDLGYPAPPRGGPPSVYWCIDTHRMDELVPLGLTNRWDKAEACDLVCSAQRNRAAELGGPWLPLAYDPSVIRAWPGARRR